MEAMPSSQPNRIFVHDQGGNPLNVVALRDDLFDCIHAKGAVESLTSAAGGEVPVETWMWSFDMLTRLDLRHASLAKGREADVLIIAADASRPIPAYVKSWMTACLREHRKGAPVMVGLYEEFFDHRDSLSALHSDLVSFAAQWRAPLLCNREWDDQLQRASVRELFGHLTPKAQQDFALQSLLAVPSAGRWGLNE